MRRARAAIAIGISLSVTLAAIAMVLWLADEPDRSTGNAATASGPRTDAERVEVWMRLVERARRARQIDPLLPIRDQVNSYLESSNYTLSPGHARLKLTNPRSTMADGMYRTILDYEVVTADPEASPSFGRSGVLVVGGLWDVLSAEAYFQLGRGAPVEVDAYFAKNADGNTSIVLVQELIFVYPRFELHPAE